MCPGETLTAPSRTNIHVCIKILLLYAKDNDLSKPVHDNIQRYFKLTTYFEKNIIISLPFFREFSVTSANFLKTRCMVRPPSCCSELEFPGVNLLVPGSLALP